MRVLVACEFSGRVRDSFIAKGHTAISCDFLPSEGNPNNPHYQGNVFDILGDGFDLLIAFYSCTDLASSGARYFEQKRKDGRQALALENVRRLLDAPISRICLENPVGVISTAIRKPSQIIQPWQFGHRETKATCLWLKNLPLLVPTKIETIRNENLTVSGQNKLGGKLKNRAKIRSLTYQGIANAMAEQWSNL